MSRTDRPRASSSTARSSSACGPSLEMFADLGSERLVAASDLRRRIVDEAFRRLQPAAARAVAVALPGLPPRARSSPAQAPPGSPLPAPPRQSGGSPASPTRSVHPATTDGLRSDRKAIGGSASSPVFSSAWGASLLVPAPTGMAFQFLSEDAPLPNFPASLGLHRSSKPS